MTARVVVLSNRSRFSRNVRKKGKANILPRIERTGIEIVAEVERSAANLFNEGRVPARRRPGPRLHGSFYFKIDGEEFPFRLRILSRAAKVKVNSLDQGSSPHPIPTKGKGLLVPAKRWPGGGFYFGSPHYFKNNEAPRQKFLVVNHPGTKQTDFIKKSAERAKRRVLARR